jgi:hypothetical protein
MYNDSIQWLIMKIKLLPSDEAVPSGTPGYNNYSTQKDHWLGWLDLKSGTGTYARKDERNRDARFVYNHIMEPKMLVWLTKAAGVEKELIVRAIKNANEAKSMASQSATIRRNIPWKIVESALSKL